MAEFLIRKAKHFAEATQPVGWSSLKWSGRPLQGDIVEVRENGFYRIEALGTGTHGWNRDAFALIRITNLSLAAAATFSEGYSNATDIIPATKFFKHRRRLAGWASISWSKASVTVGGKLFEEWYYIRPNLTGIVVTDKAA